MRQFLLVAALLVALCNTDLSAAPLSDAEIAAMLAAHNAVRQRVAQAESLRLGGTVSIPDLTWDPSVAAIAQAHADSLINSNPPKGQHRTDEELQQLGLGENWYLAWSTDTPDQSASVAVESWANEAQWYNYDENTCAAPPNKTCGHYTQLVWSSTQRLGAGRAVRTTNDGRTYVIWVCNYAPPGNTTGQKPYSVTHGGGEPGEQAEGSHTTRHSVAPNIGTRRGDGISAMAAEEADHAEALRRIQEAEQTVAATTPSRNAVAQNRYNTNQARTCAMRTRT